MAPARPFVEMALGHAALIIATAPGTPFGMAEANFLWADDLYF